MAIDLIRIDDRFIHGLVIIGWARALRCKQIVVANDKVAKNEPQKKLMRIATPDEIKIFILTINEAADLIKKGQFDILPTILLISNPKDALQLVQEGVSIKNINVGGMKFTPDRKQLFPSISMNDEEMQVCRQLAANYGIELEVRTSPESPAANLLDHI
ncbi:MAG: PTS sugar transporter subunit IIB [bacterium]